MRFVEACEEEVLVVVVGHPLEAGHCCWQEGKRMCRSCWGLSECPA